MRIKLFLSLLLSVLLLSGCGYNQIQINDEQVNAAWSEVLNQYKRRADLIPNLVQVVQGYAAHEKEVLTRVTEARANVAGMKVTPELVNDPEAMARFQKAQGELSGALSRLLVVAENYPNLKADASFRDLQAQLEGTENRITVARNRYIKSVQEYNVRCAPSRTTSPRWSSAPGPRPISPSTTKPPSARRRRWISAPRRPRPSRRPSKLSRLAPCATRCGCRSI